MWKVRPYKQGGELSDIIGSFADDILFFRGMDDLKRQVRGKLEIEKRESKKWRNNGVNLEEKIEVVVVELDQKRRNKGATLFEKKEIYRRKGGRD